MGQQHVNVRTHSLDLGSSTQHEHEEDRNYKPNSGARGEGDDMYDGDAEGVGAPSDGHEEAGAFVEPMHAAASVGASMMDDEERHHRYHEAAMLHDQEEDDEEEEEYNARRCYREEYGEGYDVFDYGDD